MVNREKGKSMGSGESGWETGIWGIRVGDRDQGNPCYSPPFFLKFCVKFSNSVLI